MFSDNKKLFYATTLSEYQRMMRWQLIIKWFGPNIQPISAVDNIVSYTIIILPSASLYKYARITSKVKCHTNELFAIGRVEDNEYFFVLNILNVQREQQKELRKVNTKLSA